MDFLYFPEDKSEYIPGIISVIVIFILSMLIIWLLVRASKKEVKRLEEQGYTVTYEKNSTHNQSAEIEEKQDADTDSDNIIDKDKKEKP